GSVDEQGGIPARHHGGAVGAEQAAVGLVPVPDVRRIPAGAQPQVGEAVLVAPAAVGGVHDVQLPVGVPDRLGTLVDERVADHPLPRFPGLGDHEPAAGRGGGAAHPGDVEVLLDVGGTGPAG